MTARARARHTDPWTSHEAAASVQNVTDKQVAVLDCFERHGPMTDEELRGRYHGEPQSSSGLRTRRHELVKLGLLHAVGSRMSATRRTVIVWNVRDETKQQLGPPKPPAPSDEPWLREFLADSGER
jgi:hypothetical protein